MSNKRSVMIAFPGGSAPREVQSDATTWGVLKQELKDELNESFENQKVRDHETNHHYSDNAAILPEGNLKLLVSTDKNKSGMPVTKANYHKAPYSELRTFCKKMTGFAPNGKTLCLDALDKHYGKILKSVPPTKAAPAKKAATASKVVKETVKAAPKKASGDYAALEKRVKALEDLQSDSFLQAARQLK